MGDIRTMFKDSSRNWVRGKWWANHKRSRLAFVGSLQWPNTSPQALNAAVQYTRLSPSIMIKPWPSPSKPAPFVERSLN